MRTYAVTRLLSDLQKRIERVGIDAQPEGVYAEDKRSDIRVSFDGFNVPVEIKRSCHNDLWTAVHAQLIAKYTRDPGAGGIRDLPRVLVRRHRKMPTDEVLGLDSGDG